MTQRHSADIDAYIAGFPVETQAMLSRLRELIGECVPGGVETISYAIPTVDFGGRHVVHFAGYAHHVALYPAPVGAPGFEDLAPYASGKGTARFPIGEPLPEDLIRRVVRYQLEWAQIRRGV